MLGTLSLLTHYGKVLFDTGDTTSFLAKHFVDQFGISCTRLEYPITVVSAGGTLLVTHVKLEQIITICNCNYYADLFVLPLKNIEAVLAMDWMTEYGAQIDCEEKIVSLRKPGGGRVTYQADKHTHIEVELQLNSLAEAKLEDIPVVNEFPDVFPQELPGMPDFNSGNSKYINNSKKIFR